MWKNNTLLERTTTCLFGRLFICAIQNVRTPDLGSLPLEMDTVVPLSSPCTHALTPRIIYFCLNKYHTHI
jgi:hypothetical protein